MSKEGLEPSRENSYAPQAHASTDSATSTKKPTSLINCTFVLFQIICKYALIQFKTNSNYN